MTVVNLKNIRKNTDLYLLFLPVLLYFAVFHYWPMYGVQIAFKDYLATQGITGSPWVGFKHFQRFFRSYDFWIVISNTITLSLYSLAVGFPVPIVLALMINEIRNKPFKKTVQMVTYAPHFISTVVLVGMLVVFLSPRTGIVNVLIERLGGEPVFFMARPEWFKSLYVFSGVWQNAGWGTIIYLSTLAGIDPQLHEAAIVDGASKLKRIIHIDIPGILPTAVILLILNVGRVMSVGFEKVFLMQNPLNMVASDVIATYVYRNGLLGGQFSFAAAVGLFNAVINFLLLLTVNRAAKGMGQASLW